MELRKVLGNTYVLETKKTLLGVYMVDDSHIILMDTGYYDQDREDLVSFFEENNYSPVGIISSHTHFDHTGNVRYLQEMYHCPVATQVIEAGIAISPNSYRLNYPYMSFDGCKKRFDQTHFVSDIVIPADASTVEIAGVTLGVLQLPGHSLGQIGIITPDHVAYLADALVGPSILQFTKLPTSFDVQSAIDTRHFMRTLQCKAYILAHRDVVEDINELIDANLERIYTAADNVFHSLKDGMTIPEWMQAFCFSVNMHTNNEMKLTLTERNFYNYVCYLVDQNRVEFRWENFMKRYYKK